MFQSVKDVLAAIAGQPLQAGTNGRTYVKFEDDGVTANVKITDLEDGGQKLNVRVTAISDAGEDLVDDLIEAGIVSNGTQYTHGYLNYEGIEEEDSEECKDLYRTIWAAHVAERDGLREERGPSWIVKPGASKPKAPRSRSRRRGGNSSL